MCMLQVTCPWQAVTLKNETSTNHLLDAWSKEGRGRNEGKRAKAQTQGDDDAYAVKS